MATSDSLDILPKDLRLSTVLAAARQKLARAGVANPMLDARLLIGHVLGLDQARLIADPDRRLSAREHRLVDDLIARRGRREPVSRIIGIRPFWKHQFALNGATLDPRPDSETVVEAALEAVRFVKDNAPAGRLRLLDLGTGSGCLLISLLGELPEAFGVGVDLSHDAVSAARINADMAGVGERSGFVVGSWTRPVGGPFDLVICNPPYIRSDELGQLAAEVLEHDPRAALDGGRDGLDAYRAIIPDLGGVLADGGWAVFETGADQAQDVSALFEANGFAAHNALDGLIRDLAGRFRCVRYARNDVLTPLR
jgi:release factor glutamine methyltransferase